MRHIFLVNSFSLKDRTSLMISRIKEYADKNELDYLIEVNDINNSTEDILKKYKKSEYIIYAVGGDGIMNRVLNSIYGTKNILSFIPCGTGNDFSRTARETLKNGYNEVDIVKLNDMYSINVACFGIDADIGNTDLVVHNKFIPKSQRYNASVVKNFAKYKPRYFKIEVDGNKMEDYFTTICICNAKYYGSGFIINPDGLINDGKFDVIIVDKVNKLNLIKVILKIKSGKHIDLDVVKHIRTDKITFKSDKPIKANVDGEILEDKVFKIKMCKEKMKVYYNSDMIDELK